MAARDILRLRDWRAMAVPQGYSVRAPRADEAAAVATIFEAYDVSQFDARDTSAAEIEEDWARPRFERERDSWLVIAEGRPVAYASIWDEHPQVDFYCDAVVHPDHWGRGLGGLLLELMEGRAYDDVAMAPVREPVVLHNVVPRSDQQGAALLSSRGYERVRTFLRMVADLSRLPSTPGSGPPGIELAPLRRGRDEQAFFDTMMDSFAGGWRFDPGPYEEWAVRMSLPDFDPGLWWLAWDDGRVAGALEGRPVDEALGWIKNLGVRPDYRRRGIGAALLSRVFAEFKGRGCKRVELGVDSANETRATALYERIGMHPAQKFDFYAKRLSR
jgi:mycothiol synthase